jgi:cathepsin B
MRTLKFKTIVALLALFSCTLADNKHPVRQEIVNDIKKKTSKWIPKEVHENQFTEIPYEMLTSKLGFLGIEQQNSFVSKVFDYFSFFRTTKAPSHQRKIVGSAELPDHFDFREKWP